MDIREHNRSIDLLDRPTYNISNEKRGLQNNQYRKQHNMAKHIIGCWTCDVDHILLANCHIESLIWINRWTCWVSSSQSAQCREVGKFPSNGTRIDSSGVSKTGTANLWMVWFGPWPVLKWWSGTVANTRIDQCHAT